MNGNIGDGGGDFYLGTPAPDSEKTVAELQKEQPKEPKHFTAATNPKTLAQIQTESAMELVASNLKARIESKNRRAERHGRIRVKIFQAIPGSRYKLSDNTEYRVARDGALVRTKNPNELTKKERNRLKRDARKAIE